MNQVMMLGEIYDIPITEDDVKALYMVLHEIDTSTIGVTMPKIMYFYDEMFNKWFYEKEEEE